MAASPTPTTPYASYLEAGTRLGIKPDKVLATAERFAREGMQKHLAAAVLRAGL